MTRTILATLALSLVACVPAPPDGPGTPSTTTSAITPTPSTMTTVSGFSNPGNLDMYEYVPNGALSGALVVALHGCTQSAAIYEDAGWSNAADVYGFVVLYPQQPSSNNQESCFNWYDQDDTLRNGESLSIANAIQHELDQRHLDAQRVYVTGLSAGGAFTAVMLADYPDRGTSHTTFTGFAAGSIMAGLPFGAACTGTDHSTCPTGSSYGNAFQAENPGVTMAASDWGDRVRAASPNATRWPRVSIWGGTADAVVNPTNVTELVKQWTNVNGLDQAPSATDSVNGNTHDTYVDSNGHVLVEDYHVSGMGHGTAIDSHYDFTAGAEVCGTATAYILDEGICSTYYSLTFWGEAPTGAGVETDGGTGSGGADGGLTLPGLPTASSCTAVSATVSAHVQAGRAVDYAGLAYAKGSYELLGADNALVTLGLVSYDGDVWWIGTCP